MSDVTDAKLYTASHVMFESETLWLLEGTSHFRSRRDVIHWQCYTGSWMTFTTSAFQFDVTNLVILFLCFLYECLSPGIILDTDPLEDPPVLYFSFRFIDLSSMNFLSLPVSFLFWVKWVALPVNTAFKNLKLIFVDTFSHLSFFFFFYNIKCIKWENIWVNSGK